MWMETRDSKGTISEKIDNLAQSMEKMKIAEYVEYLSNTPRMLYINFIAGLARGLGMAVGFTLLGALVIYLLQKLVLLNLPGISNFIAQIIQLVNFSIKKSP